MVVWTVTLTAMEVHGILPEQQEVRTRMHIYWATSITMVGSLLAVRFQELEDFLRTQEDSEAAKMLSEEMGEGGAGGEGANGGGDASSMGSDPADVASRSRAEQMARLSRIAAVVDFSDLAQATLGWVAGCAWTDVALALVPSISATPSVSVVLTNALAAIGQTLCSVLWLVLSGAPVALSDAELVDRERVERHFITSALSFLVGWT